MGLLAVDQFGLSFDSLTKVTWIFTFPIIPIQVPM